MLAERELVAARPVIVVSGHALDRMRERFGVCGTIGSVARQVSEAFADGRVSCSPRISRPGAVHPGTIRFARCPNPGRSGDAIFVLRRRRIEGVRTYIVLTVLASGGEA